MWAVWSSITSSTRRQTEAPEEFWAKFAEERLHWFSKWSQTLEWDPPFAKWFVGGKTNMSYNCVDRHLATAAQEQGGHHLGRRTRETSGSSPIRNSIARSPVSPTR